MLKKIAFHAYYTKIIICLAYMKTNWKFEIFLLFSGIELNIESRVNLPFHTVFSCESIVID